MTSADPSIPRSTSGDSEGKTSLSGAAGQYVNHVNNSNTLLLTRKIVFQAQGNNIQAFNRRSREFIRQYNGHTLDVTCLRIFDFVLYSGSEVRSAQRSLGTDFLRPLRPLRPARPPPPPPRC